MRKLILVGAALWWMWSAPQARSAILFTDSFGYSDGPLVSVSTNLWGTNVWLHHSPSNNRTGEVLAASGRVFLSQANYEDVSAFLDGQPYPSSTNVLLYASFTINFTALPSSGGDYFAHFKDTGASNFRARLYAGTSGAAPNCYRVGILGGSSGTPNMLTNDLALNTDYTLVMRYAPSNATSVLWVNPSAESDPGVTNSDAPTTLTVSTFALRESTGIGNLYLDNLLIGTSFNEVLSNPTPVPPYIITQPANQILTEGADATFSVAAGGTPAPAYQWQFNGADLSGATGASLTLSNVSVGQAGTYTVALTNSAGFTSSRAAVLTVSYAPPVITSQPLSQTVNEGAGVTFTVVASSTAPVSYQWKFNGADMAGATASALVLSNLALLQAGTYVAGVTNAGGGTYSQPATLTVTPLLPAPAFSLLTYNVKGNGATDWSTNTAQVQAIGRQLRYLRPDIITFNEIPLASTWQMTNWVTAFLPGYNLATNSGTDGYIRSVIASRFPIRRSQKWLDGVSLASFGYNGYFSRDLFEAQIAVPNFSQPLHVFVTHLKATTSSPQEDANKRAAEASAISNFFVTVFLTTNASHPYVLSGDMNEDILWPGSYVSGQPIQRLISPPTGLQLTTPLNPVTLTGLTLSIQAKLNVRFDYILPCSSLFSNVISSQVFRTDLLNSAPPPLLANDDITASDHLPVVMSFGNPFSTPFRMLSVNLTNRNLTLAWEAISNRQYRVEASSDLRDWSVFAASLTATGTSHSFSTNVAEPARFYRVYRLP